MCNIAQHCGILFNNELFSLFETQKVSKRKKKERLWNGLTVEVVVVGRHCREWGCCRRQCRRRPTLLYLIRLILFHVLQPKLLPIR